MNDSHGRVLQSGHTIHCPFDRAEFEREEMSEAEYEGYQQLDEQERWEAIDQYLRDLMRALSDGDHWVNKESRRIPLKKIKPRHARNIIGWLRKRAPFLHDLAVLDFMKITRPTASAAMAGFDTAFDSLDEMDPVEWLMQTPLVLNLKEKVQRHEDRLR